MRRSAPVLHLAMLTAVAAMANQEHSTTVNLLSLQEGTFPVIAADSYGGWPAEALLDGDPESGWACAKEQIHGNVFVFEMVGPAILERFEFDTASIDEEGAAAREVTVEVSDASAQSGFKKVLHTSLAPQADGQAFPASSRVSGRWVRLTLHSNYGNATWTELFSFRGFGTRGATPAAPGDISGTYDSTYSRFHVRQQGSALVGCYEMGEGVLHGAIEGRVMKLTWREAGNDMWGPAVMVFAPDGSSFRGYWWTNGTERSTPSGHWEGSKISAQVGGCPHWKGSLAGEMRAALASDGRTKVYGILFDLNSATIRDDSRPVLEEILSLLRQETQWRIVIEGHTDATGGEAHNQALSQRRADAVKTFLQTGGISGDRLETQGFGASTPVADNATELGRAQNRRVELVKR